MLILGVCVGQNAGDFQAALADLLIRVKAIVLCDRDYCLTWSFVLALVSAMALAALEALRVALANQLRMSKVASECKSSERLMNLVNTISVSPLHLLLSLDGLAHNRYFFDSFRR